MTDFGHFVLNIKETWSIERPSEDFAGTSIYIACKFTSLSGRVPPPRLESIDICDWGSSLREIVAGGTTTENYEKMIFAVARSTVVGDA